MRMRAAMTGPLNKRKMLMLTIIINTFGGKGLFETDRINIVDDYVLKNFRRKILLKELAEVLNMTPTSFSRYFTMKNNKSFFKICI